MLLTLVPGVGMGAGGDPVVIVTPVYQKRGRVSARYYVPNALLWMLRW